MIDRRKITAKLRQRLEELPYIHAFWLEGADANGTIDEYSDLDYWVDFDDAFEAQAIEAVESALSELSEIEYKYVVAHEHPKIRQRMYRLKDTSEYLLIDFCWQLHSRPREESCYDADDPIEAAKVVFDKDNVVWYWPQEAARFESRNNARLAEAKYLRTQHVRAEKYIHRGQYLEAYAYYNRYVFQPLIDVLRLIYTPAHADYSMVHISQHIPAEERSRLEYFAKNSSLEDLAEKIPQAGEWFDTLVERLEK